VNVETVVYGGKIRVAVDAGKNHLQSGPSANVQSGRVMARLRECSCFGMHSPLLRIRL